MTDNDSELYPTPDWLTQYGCEVRDMLGLDRWELCVKLVEAQVLEFEHDSQYVRGDCEANARSFSATIRLCHDLSDDDLRDTLMHEMLHVRLQLIDHTVRLRITELLPTRLQGHAQGLFDDVLEQTIEELAQALRRKQRVDLQEQIRRASEAYSLRTEPVRIEIPKC